MGTLNQIIYSFYVLGERMEEGSEIADTDGDVNMDSNLFINERLSPRNGKHL